MSKVFIEVGHGGKDSGAVAGKFVEKDINLKVALAFKVVAERNGFEVKLSREDDTFVDLNTIAKMANDWGADIVIGIHHNAGGGDGYEVIHSVFYGQGTVLARLIGQEFAGLGQNAHGVGLMTKTNSRGGDYFCTIRETKAPAVITEYAFIDSADAQAVDTDSELKQEAEAICRAVCAFFGKSYDEDHQEKDEITDLIHALAGHIQIDEGYWEANAREGKQIEGKYVAVLLKRMKDGGLI